MGTRGGDGPHPVRRAIVGILLGLALGALAALVLPRRAPAPEGSRLRGRTAPQGADVPGGGPAR